MHARCAASAPLFLLASLPLLSPAALSARPPTPDPTYGLLRRAQQAMPLIGKSASWIWAANTSETQVVGARTTINLDAAPSDATLWVTADNYFTAYVNGQQVAHTELTPGNGWENVQQVRVTGQLHTGANQLAILGHNAGGPAGILAVLHVTVHGKTTDYVTGPDWKVTENPPDGWYAPGFDASTWAPATAEAALGSGVWATQMQGWPGLSGSGLQRMDLPVVSVLHADAHRGGITGSASLVGRGPASLVMSPAPAGAADNDQPAVTLDFGQETSGRVDITNGSAGPITLALRYGESEEEAANGPFTGVQKLTIPAGETGHGVDSAFRYAIILLLSAPAPGASIPAVRLNMDYYPVDYLGSFDCSDPLLTRIWYVAAYTAHLCMQQDIWDAPKRDRARWMGDLHVSGEVINNVFLDRPLMEQTMDRLRAEAGNPPTGHVNNIPGYSCAWVAGMADFVRHTGDMEYARAHHDDLVSMMDYFDGEVDAHNVFANRRGKWDFADWSEGFNGAGPHSAAATHFFMVRMYHDGAWLLNAMGDSAAAARFERKAQDATAAAQQYLLDTATSTFGDRWQDNSMAIFSGAATRPQATAIWNQVLSHPYPENLFMTPYYHNYTIAAMSLAGHTPEALQFVRDYWGGMLQEGATTFWEGYDTRWPKEHYHQFLKADNGQGYFVSLCHGWSAGAGNFLTERVLGIRPTGPGFSTVEIQPQLCDLKWASGRVPTPHGPIDVRCRRSGADTVIDVDIPDGVKAAITMPGPGTPTFNGHHFHAVCRVAG